jgi:cytochrome c553
MTIRTLLLTMLVAFSVGSAKAQEQNLIADGARLWAANCTRCHNARSPAERTDVSWKTVVNHMRVRANLTKDEARKITVYLQLVNVPVAKAHSDETLYRLAANDPAPSPTRRSQPKTLPKPGTKR